MFFFFFFNDTATTDIYTLSLHDALPIFLTSPNFLMSCTIPLAKVSVLSWLKPNLGAVTLSVMQDRKSTRLNSSHGYISYAVFCLKKKKNISTDPTSSLYGHYTQVPSTLL